jgi:5-formyltetrahydrofolate cyclo-ligase
MTEAERSGASAQARELLAVQAQWREAQSILFFAPLPGELDVWPLLGEALQSGKRVFLPRFVATGEKPLQRFEDRPAAHDTLLKQGVNETIAAPGTPQERGAIESGRYVVCEIRDADKDILSGQFGIREPVAACAELTLNRLDLILVPGVAFDLHGRRLGRGKGFYDRLLAVVRGTTCGAAFDEQIVGEIPVEPHDVHLNCILTPTRWIAL